ncbi:hypothetical protein QF049_004981 [Paenibacillus sp. W4I10]|nr:hypothetical protein [Paenibacillus sp. W4I10]
MHKRMHRNEEDRKKLEKRSGRIYPRISPFYKESKKSGDNGDRKVVLSSKWSSVILVFIS